MFGNPTASRQITFYQMPSSPLVNQLTLDRQRQDQSLAALGQQQKGQQALQQQQQEAAWRQLLQQQAGTMDMAKFQQSGTESLAGLQNAAEMARLQAQLGNQQGIVGRQQEGETQRANIAAEAAKYPAMLRQQNFEKLLPMFQQGWQGAMGMLGGQGGGPMGPGGAAPASFGPEITTGGVLNPQQTQQMVNAGYATAQKGAASQMRQARNRAAGQGTSVNSPLLQALQANLGMAALGQGVGNEREIRANAAQMNAKQLLASQQAREQQYAARQAEALQGQGQRVSTLNALLAALGGAF